MTASHTVDALVIGEALIDVVHTENHTAEHVGGSPANVALGLGRRGADVALLTSIGDDERGRRIATHIEDSGARVLPASFSQIRTATAEAHIKADSSADYRFDLTWNHFVHDGREAPYLVHTGSIASLREPGAESIRALIQRLNPAEITLDPNIRPDVIGTRDDVLHRFESLARLCTVVKMSDEDAGWLYPDRTVDQVLDVLLSFGARLAAITQGENGAILATASDRIHVESRVHNVVDTIGAGDTFMASLIHSLLEHRGLPIDRDNLQTIGENAVRAAAITVSRAGADLPWAAELDA